MRMSFSALHRDKWIREAGTDRFDLLIIGGGATGAGIALDAASRGLKTILIEKKDFASGTSSKSTKLIHGGLRYLKQLEFKLVHESGTERAVVNTIAPHLVRPEKMLLPLVDDGTFGKISTSIGLRVYDFLAEVGKTDRRKMLSKEETLIKEPLLDKDRIVGGGYYAEYRTDDARLTIELIKKAVEFGAVALNYCKVVDLLHNDGMISGVECRDVIGGITVNINATKVVSAAGPWVDDIRRLNDSITDKRLHLTKGVHLVVLKKKMPIKQSIYFDTPDGRMIFAIPRGRIVYIGTTDTTYHGDKDHIVVTKADRDYLIKAVNGMFPEVGLTAENVISNWAGLRPLIHQEGKAPSELSRKDEIFEAKDGLISIAGGKLTGYRKMAQKIVDKILENDLFKVKQASSFTETIHLCGDCIGSNQEVDQYIEAMQVRVDEMGLDPYYGGYLVTNYGKQTESILNYFDAGDSHSPEIQLALAECQYGLEHEMIVRAEDYFIRRTGRLFFDIQSIEVIRKPVMDLMTKALKWDNQRRAIEEGMLDEHLKDATFYYENEDLLSGITS